MISSVEGVNAWTTFPSILPHFLCNTQDVPVPFSPGFLSLLFAWAFLSIKASTCGQNRALRRQHYVLFVRHTSSSEESNGDESTIRVAVDHFPMDMRPRSLYTGRNAISRWLATGEPQQMVELGKMESSGSNCMHSTLSVSVSISSFSVTLFTCVPSFAFSSFNYYDDIRLMPFRKAEETARSELRKRGNDLMHITIPNLTFTVKVELGWCMLSGLWAKSAQVYRTSAPYVYWRSKKFYHLKPLGW